MQSNKVIDRKFRFLAVNPVNGKIYSQDEAIVFCAKDAAVPEMLLAYRNECKILGCDENHIASIELLYDRVKAFQKEHGLKIADTIGLEVDRCVKGEGLE